MESPDPQENLRLEAYKRELKRFRKCWWQGWERYFELKKKYDDLANKK